MNKLPEGPSPAQTERDRITGALVVFNSMLRETYRRKDALGWDTPKLARWSEGEKRDYELRLTCEIEALETGIRHLIRAQMEESIIDVAQDVLGEEVPTLGENTC